jgi:glutamate/tyrosine decarboxylase-like PLP-dependent enzyme
MRARGPRRETASWRTPRHFTLACPTPRATRSGRRPREIRDFPIEERGTDLSDLLSLVERTVDTPGINSASAGHMGYIPGGGIYAAALGDLIAAVTNRYAGVRFASPGAVEMEEAALAWMADLVGFGAGWGGNLTSGGSLANLIGVVTAREAHGLRAREYERAVVYSTSQVHHCIDKALRVAGMADAIRREVGHRYPASDGSGGPGQGRGRGPGGGPESLDGSGFGGHHRRGRRGSPE